MAPTLGIPTGHQGRLLAATRHSPYQNGDSHCAAASTGKLAIIEIKKPSSSLIKKAPYREDVYAPSGELRGAVAQLLDQRFKLP
jgi:hypothetical protein